jgi:hypothetical protein
MPGQVHSYAPAHPKNPVHVIGAGIIGLTRPRHRPFDCTLAASSADTAEERPARRRLNPQWGHVGERHEDEIPAVEARMR